MEVLNQVERKFHTAKNHTLCSWDSKIIKITMYSILMFLSLVGNSLIVAVFYRSNRLRTTVHYFIVNMAVSDLLVPMILLPMLVGEVYYNDQWLVGGVLGTILCKFVWITVYVSVAVSTFSMVAIAFDRFYAIVFTMKPALFSQKNCHRLIIATWIVSVAIQAYYIYAVEVIVMETEMICHNALEKVSFSCLFALIAIVLTVLYSTIIIVLYRQKANLHLASETVKLRAKENRKVTSMLVTLVVSFYLVWVPPNMYEFQETDKCALAPIIDSIPLWYTAVNFLIFFIFNKAFRQGCRELLCRPWLCTNKCNVSGPCHENSVPNSGQQNHPLENIELREQ